MSRHEPPNAGPWPAILLVAVGAAICLPSIVLGMLLAPLARWRRGAMFVVALLGLGATALLYPQIAAEMESGVRAVQRARGLSVEPGRALRGRMATRQGVVDGDARTGTGGRLRDRAIPSTLGRGGARARGVPC